MVAYEAKCTFSYTSFTLKSKVFSEILYFFYHGDSPLESNKGYNICDLAKFRNLGWWLKFRVIASQRGTELLKDNIVFKSSSRKFMPLMARPYSLYWMIDFMLYFQLIMVKWSGENFSWTTSLGLNFLYWQCLIFYKRWYKSAQI